MDLTARYLNLISCDQIDGVLHCTAKTRHSQVETPCSVVQTEADTLLVRFEQPVRAITPGKAVVLYDGDTVIRCVEETATTENNGSKRAIINSDGATMMIGTDSTRLYVP